MAQAPAQFDMKDAVPLNAAAPAQFDMGDAVPLQDFTANENNEGTYEMAGPSGKKVKIPYGMIGTASQAGYKMTDADRERYVKDSAADPHLNEGKNLPEGVKVTGKNSAGQDIVAPKGTAEGSPLSRFASAEYQAIGSGVKGLVKLLDPRPNEEEKKRAETTGPVASTFDILMRYPERLIQPNVDMAVQAGDEAKAGNISSAAEHGIASMIPGAGPFVASAIDSTGQSIAQGDIAGAAGNVVGNAMVAEAPKVLGKVATGVAKTAPKLAGTFVESVTKTAPREVKAMVEETQKENEAAATAAKDKNDARADKHLNKTIDALQEANKHAQKEGFRSDELEKKNEQHRLEFNKKELERVKSEGEDRLQKLKENKEKLSDYEQRRDAIKRENERNYRREVQKQNLQSKLKAATTKLDNLYQKTFKSATTSYNNTWNSWRDMMTKANAKADMTPTVNTINSLEKSMNPEQVGIFRDILKETAPQDVGGSTGDVDAANKVAEATLYDVVTKKLVGGSIKQAIAGAIDPGMEIPVIAGFQEMAADAKGDLKAAKEAQKSSAALTTVPAARLHGWKSQLEQAVRQTKDGTVRFAIAQVLDQVRKTETDVSASVGPDAVKQLTKARAITKPYFDAFFKSPDDLPRAAGQSLREQNPEYVKEKAAQERLDRIAKYNPEITGAATHVATITQGLEDLLKKKDIGKRSELPVHPEGSVMTPSGAKLDRKDSSLPAKPTPAGTFEPKPFNAKSGPKDAVVPNRPPEEIAAEKRLSPEDYKKWKAENVARAAQRIRDLSISRAMYAGMNALPVSIASFALGHPGAAVLELTTPASVIGFSSAVANLLEKPGVVEYLSRITSKDVAAFERLPPEQKRIFTQDMTALTKEAKKQGVTISPVFSAFLKASTLAGATTEQKRKPTPKELLEEAHKNLHSDFQQQGFAPQ